METRRLGSRRCHSPNGFNLPHRDCRLHVVFVECADASEMESLEPREIVRGVGDLRWSSFVLKDVLEVALGPADFYHHHLCQRVPALPRTAHRWQTDSPQARRYAAGVEYLHGLLPIS